MRPIYYFQLSFLFMVVLSGFFSNSYFFLDFFFSQIKNQEQKLMTNSNGF